MKLKTLIPCSLIVLSLYGFNLYNKSSDLDYFLLCGSLITAVPLFNKTLLQENPYIKIPYMSFILIYINITYFTSVFFIDEIRETRYEISQVAIQLAIITSIVYLAALIFFNARLNVKCFSFLRNTTYDVETVFLKLLILSLFLKLLAYIIPTTTQLFFATYLLTLATGFHLYLSKGFHNQSARIVFFMLFIIEIIARLTSGLLAEIVSISFLFTFIYLRIKKKIPVLPILLLVVLYIILSSIKGEYRRELSYLKDDSYFNKITILTDLISQHGKSSEGYKEVNPWNRLANNIDMLAAVTELTPKDVPYWNGTTLTSMFYKPIPRFIWPEKPIENLGQEFPRRYNLIDESDIYTSINLPWYSELYINFGSYGMLIGIILISYILVFLLKKFTDADVSPDNLNYLPGYIILTSLIYQESNLSLMFGGALLYFFSYYLIFKYFIY